MTTPPLHAPVSHPAPVAEPRLGGALMVLFWCACGITALPLAGLFTLIATLGPAGAKSALFDSFAGPTLAQQVMRIGLVPQLFLFAWSGSLVVLTVAKSRHALTVSPLLMAAWVLSSVYSQFAIRSAIAVDGADLAAFAALMPGLLAQAAGAVAFYGYFREGARPKAYFRR